MPRTQKISVSLLAAAIVLAGTASLTKVVAQDTASVPKKQDTVALGADEVKQLVLLMDTDKNGKISKKEFMAYMSAEFDRLDKDKSGELDPKELAKSAFRPAAKAPVGK